MAGATVDVTQSSGLTLVKTASSAGAGPGPGASIDYDFAVTNTGNVSLTSLSIADSLAAPAGPALSVTCPSAPLAPGGTASCTASYTVTQADVDNGSVNNQATALAVAPSSATVTSNESTASVPIAQAPALTLAKSVTPQTADEVGDRVDYTFAVTNSGDTTITDLAIDDTLTAPAGPLSPISCPVTTLAPDQVTECTASYVLTQADVDHGSVDNSATASGTAPAGATVTSNTSTATVTVAAAPALSLTKSAAPTTVSAAGATLGYTFSVTNTGNVTLNSLAIVDTFEAPAGPPLAPIDCGSATLAPNESTTCTADYTVTQADVDHGEIRNTAHATALDPAGGSVLSGDDDGDGHHPAGPGAEPGQDRLPHHGVRRRRPGRLRVPGHQHRQQHHHRASRSTTCSAHRQVRRLTPTCPASTLAPTESTTCTATYTRDPGRPRQRRDRQHRDRVRRREPRGQASGRLQRVDAHR